MLFSFFYEQHQQQQQLIKDVTHSVVAVAVEEVVEDAL